MVFSGEKPAGCAVAATDIADVIGGFDPGERGDGKGEMINGVRDALVAVFPIAVMKILAPGIAIESIERVVEAGDIVADGRFPGGDHQFVIIGEGDLLGRVRRL